MTLYDFLGNQLKVGDIITYVVSSGEMKIGLIQAFVKDSTYVTYCRIKIINKYNNYSYKAKKMVTKVRSVYISGGADGNHINGIMVIKNPEFYMSCPAIQNILEIIQDSNIYIGEVKADEPEPVDYSSTDDSDNQNLEDT